MLGYGADVKGEFDWMKFTLSAKGYVDASDQEKITNYTQKTVTASFSADKTYCPPGNNPTCTEYDPCTGERCEFELFEFDDCNPGRTHCPGDDPTTS